MNAIDDLSSRLMESKKYMIYPDKSIIMFDFTYDFADIENEDCMIVSKPPQ